jgi:hypothetical protein
VRRSRAGAGVEAHDDRGEGAGARFRAQPQRAAPAPLAAGACSARWHNPHRKRRGRTCAETQGRRRPESIASLDGCARWRRSGRMKRRHVRGRRSELERLLNHLRGLSPCVQGARTVLPRTHRPTTRLVRKRRLMRTAQRPRCARRGRAPNPRCGASGGAARRPRGGHESSEDTHARSSHCIAGQVRRGRSAAHKSPPRDVSFG